MMNRWNGKVAVVTGASSGIGFCVAKDLMKSGMIVIGLARRVQRMEELKSNSTELDQQNGEFYSYECDITSLDSIKSAFAWINSKFSQVNVLINNAGILKYSGILTNNNEEDLKNVLDVNLMGAIYCIKEVYQIMKDQVDNECHIINMNSILGHVIPFNLGTLAYNLYPSSKFGLRAASEVIRQELTDKPNFRVSNISPGLVKTDITHTGGHPYANEIMSSKAILQVEDISSTVLFVLAAPSHVQISEIILTPVGQKF